MTTWDIPGIKASLEASFLRCDYEGLDSVNSPNFTLPIHTEDFFDLFKCYHCPFQTQKVSSIKVAHCKFEYEISLLNLSRSYPRI